MLAALGFGGRLIRCLLGFDHVAHADRSIWYTLLTRDNAPPPAGRAPLTTDELIYEPHPDADEPR